MALSQHAIVFFVLVGFCFLFLVLRLYVRVRLLHKFEAPDALVCIAWVAILYQALSQIWSSRWGFSSSKIRWFQPEPPDFESIIPDKRNITRGLILLYVRIPLTNACLYCVKISFLLLYRQIFPPGFRRLRIALNVVFVFVVMAAISNLVVDLFLCGRPSRNWTSDKADRCIILDHIKRYYYVAIVQIITDLAVYILPFSLLPTLYRASSTTRPKLVGIIGMMSIGFACILCLIIRITLTHHAGNAYLITVLGNVEQVTAVIVACCPPLRYLFSRRAQVVADLEGEKGGDRGKRGGDAEEQRVQTKTMWRVWRMGGHLGRDVRSTVETYAIGTEKLTTTVASEAAGGALLITRGSVDSAAGGGLAPMPRKYAKAAASCSVAEGLTARSDGTRGGLETFSSGSSGGQGGRRKGFWGRTKIKPLSGRHSQTNDSSERDTGRRHSATFGGTQNATYYREDEPEMPMPSPLGSNKEPSEEARTASLSPPSDTDIVSLNTLGAGSK